MSVLSDSAIAAIEAASKQIVDVHTNPLLADLPDKFTERGFFPHQVPAIKGIVDGFSRVPVVVLDAPTGSGKTVIAETVRRLLEVKAVYMCSSKSLQDQFLRDFPYAKVVKGRANYPTELYPDRFDPDSWSSHLSADDCQASTANDYACNWCSAKFRCPYEVAKNAALRSPLAVLNTSYFLAEANNIGRFAGRGLVIADEADTLESALMGYVSVEVSERRMEKYGWTPPTKMTVVDSWKEWLDRTIPDIQSKVAALGPVEKDDVKRGRERKYLVNLWEKLYAVRVGLDESDHAWVYTGKGNDGGGKAARNVGLEVSFRPSRVDAMGEKLLWGHADKWLCMTATVISAEEMLGSLGYKGPYEVVRVANTFPVKNRLVKYTGAVDMANKHRANGSWDRVSEHVANLAARHATDRVLVHSVSYDLTRHIVGRLPRERVLSYASANGRESALGKFRRTAGKVLVAPSMDRGIDLPGDACRVQIIVKCPFPYIGDRQVAARMYSKGGDMWYAVQTIRAIVQMCGRAVRSADDWAVTYVLDRQFHDNLWRRYRALFPQWFSESIVWAEREGGSNGR